MVSSSLDALADHERMRREIAGAYQSGLGGITELCLPRCHRFATHTWHKYVLRTGRRDALRHHLKCLGIETQIHYADPLPDQPVFAREAAERTIYPVARRTADTVLSLPIFPYMTNSEVARVVAGIVRFFAAG